MEWDLFISHASEDKDDFVKPLANILKELKMKVWYDEFTLKIGDSLSANIDKGLISSRYGLVVLSKSFIGKGWTDYELRSLLSREVGHSKVILPIWHNITREDIMSFSPFLVDKFALNSSTNTIEEIAMQIVEVVSPEIYYNIMRLRAAEAIREKAIRAIVSTSSIDMEQQPRHNKLPKTLLNRIIIIQKILHDVYPVSLEDTILNFKRDTNPDRELIIWEAIAATYLQYIFAKEMTIEKKKEIFLNILQLTLDNGDKNSFPNKFEYITYDEHMEIMSLYNSIIPDIHTGLLAELKNQEDTEID
jgi:hypothetical protein